MMKQYPSIEFQSFIHTGEDIWNSTANSPIMMFEITLRLFSDVVAAILLFQTTRADRMVRLVSSYEIYAGGRLYRRTILENIQRMGDWGSD
jgi:hypothetical protein